jgi:AbrB family looped-hinge helix DNA binding protein
VVRARVTSKGQVTVPVAVRRRYGIAPGDELDFRMDETGPRIVPLKKRRLTELRGLFPATKPYRGRDAIRRETGHKLGAELELKLRGR